MDDRNATGDLKEGTVLDGQFLVVSKLGQGGMGTVYIGRDTRLNRVVAIKTLPPRFNSDLDLVTRFQREARALAALDHPNVIPIHTVGTSAGVHYFVMKLIRGHSLASILQARRIDISTGVILVTQIADGLEAIHGAGFVHRDLKPANVMVEANGHATLLDFGILREIRTQGTQLTETGMVVGTPHYMAPEQVKTSRLVDRRCDIYALGVVMYEVFTGRLPFVGNSNAEIMMKHCTDVAQPPDKLNGAVAPALARVVMKALAKAPEERFQSAKELKRALLDATGKGYEATRIHLSGIAIPDRRMGGGAGVAAGPFSKTGTAVGASGTALAPAGTSPRASGIRGEVGAAETRVRRRWLAGGIAAGFLVAAVAVVAMGPWGKDVATPKTVPAAALVPMSAPALKPASATPPATESAPEPSPEPEPEPTPEPAQSTLRVQVLCGIKRERCSANVSLDDATPQTGHIPVFKTTPGPHKVSIHKDGFKPVERTVHLAKLFTEEYEIILEPNDRIADVNTVSKPPPAPRRKARRTKTLRTSLPLQEASRPLAQSEPASAHAERYPPPGHIEAPVSIREPVGAKVVKPRAPILVSQAPAANRNKDEWVAVPRRVPTGRLSLHGTPQFDVFTAKFGERPQHLGTTPFEGIELPVGSNLLTLRTAAGEFAGQFILEIEAGKTTSHTFDLTKGTIEFVVEPWADVWRGRDIGFGFRGKKLGRTPMEPVPFWPGHHTFLLVNDELNLRRRVNVKVLPGQNVIVKEKLN